MARDWELEGVVAVSVLLRIDSIENPHKPRTRINWSNAAVEPRKVVWPPDRRALRAERIGQISGDALKQEIFRRMDEFFFDEALAKKWLEPFPVASDSTGTISRFVHLGDNSATCTGTVASRMFFVDASGFHPAGYETSEGAVYEYEANSQE